MAETIAARTNEGYWVKVQDGEVLEVWDYSPDQDELDTGLWTAAVEVFPEYVAGREELLGHTIDITQNPITITYSKVSIGVDSRVDHAKGVAQHMYASIIIEEGNKGLDEYEGTTDLNRITAAKSRLDDLTEELDAVTTHDEFEAVDQTFSV